MLSRVLRVAALTFLACYVGYGLLVVIEERALVFPRPPPTTPVLTNGLQLLRIPSDGNDVVALYSPPRPGQRVVVHFHGNGEQLADLVGLAGRFHDQGLGFLAVEYPGYGLAGGTPSEVAIYGAASRAIDYVHSTLHFAASDVVLEGQSLGTGVAIEMAARGAGTRLILISPYTCIADLGKEMLPWYPRRLMVRDAFDSESKAARISIPTLIIHGTADEVVPFEMGRRLAKLIPNAQLHAVDGAQHNGTRQQPHVMDDIFAFATPR